MVCPTCHSENPDGKSFCGDCGNPLQKSALGAAIQHEVERVLSSKLKEQKSVELETSQAIVARLADWAKLFGFFVGIPLTLFFAILGFLGLKTYSDFSSRVSKAREEALRPLDSTKAEAERIAQAYKDL